MAISEYPEMFLFLLPFIFIFSYYVKRRGMTSCEPTNWPVFGMLPSFLHNKQRGWDYMTQSLIQCGGTYDFKGGLFTSVNMLLTSDPANIHHVFSKNFPNYPKGSEFRKIFEILGDGIFNSDNELWELHRKTTLSIVGRSDFYDFLEKNVRLKIQTGLMPLLEYYTEHGKEFDLQDVLQRFSFDNICKIVLEHDPNSLSPDLPYIACEKALTNITGPLLIRHLVPETIWKLQKWLKIGSEKKLTEASNALDDFIYPLVKIKKQEDGGLNLLTTFTKAYEEMNNGSVKGLTKFLRDTSLNLMLAGRDSSSTCLTWLFWLIATNPFAETKILEEIESKLDIKDGNWRFFNAEESHKLVYLHGALCESLRLFPPVPVERKSPVHPDTLPSGHYLEANKKVIFSFYTVGRMESVWGKDCLEFKPERWINDRGGIKHEPSYKFPAFIAGPRTCLGKEMGFVQMKMVASALLYHFKIQLVEGHRVSPRLSVVLQARRGLRVRLQRRDV